MNDENTTVAQLRRAVQDFSAQRGWTDGENAKDLAMALAVESAELLEIFMWLRSDRADSVRDDSRAFEHLREEAADVLWYLVRICEHFDIDLTRAVCDKAGKNAVIYPAPAR